MPHTENHVFIAVYVSGDNGSPNPSWLGHVKKPSAGRQGGRLYKTPPCIHHPALVNEKNGIRRLSIIYLSCAA